MSIETIDIPFDTESKHGTWMIATWEEGDPPLVRCPNGHGSVMKNHQIKDDGVVHGSILCPQCDWHVFAKLEGWKNHGTPD